MDHSRTRLRQTSLHVIMLAQIVTTLGEAVGGAAWLLGSAGCKKHLIRGTK